MRIAIFRFLQRTHWTAFISKITIFASIRTYLGPASASFWTFTKVCALFDNLIIEMKKKCISVEYAHFYMKPGQSWGLQSREFVWDSVGHPSFPKIPSRQEFSQVWVPPPQVTEQSPKSEQISSTKSFEIIKLVSLAYFVPAQAWGLHSFEFVFSLREQPVSPKFPFLQVFSHVWVPPPHVLEQSPKSVHFSRTKLKVKRKLCIMQWKTCMLKLKL